MLFTRLRIGNADRMSQFLFQPVSGQQRQLALMRYMKTATDLISSELRLWGLKLVDTVVISNGVLLQADQLLHLGNGDVVPVESRGWLNRLSDLVVHTPVRITDWVVIAQRGDENTVTSMVENLINDAPNLGIEISEPITCRYLQRDEAKAYVGALRSIQAEKPELQLAVVIMRASRDDIYREVKKWAFNLQSGSIATQILIRDTARAIAHRLDVSLSVITQINCKMGGDLWTLDGALTDTLVIGMSGYTGVSGEPWVGVVASKDRLFSKWYSTAFKDMSQFRFYMAKAMRKYKLENRGEVAHTTVVFRRQLPPVSHEETTALQEACGLNTAIVVVNLLDGVELAEYFDAEITNNGIEGLKNLHKKLIFVPYRKGVPTDSLVFYVEKNIANLEVEKITKVIKQLKHMYFNVAGEVPLPAPLLYAGKCVEFIADILEEPPEEKFEDTLYYL
ncbi:piwi protein 2-like [Tropilaelaps mercedesae]|uniref:Piwi protein 2-like n=1 Tax=Tropilaelaps mercedesae TaxID=418985 RepID=A0A1V9XD71_9ACAR|nr:piwi protein 2-like [Tropilaelaps mercedesae]